jgi:hypothetical protein
MQKLGIVAEGLPDTDVAIISELIKKILPDKPELCLYPGKDKPNVINKFRGWLEDCRNKNVDKALVIVDQDLSCIKIIVEKMQKKIKGRKYRFPVKFHVIERELETWLLSDEQAISRVVERDVPPVNQALEGIKDPKKKLKKILSRAKATYTPETLRKIAEESDIDRIAYRCAGFRRFRQLVLDC